MRLARKNAICGWVVRGDKQKISRFIEDNKMPPFPTPPSFYINFAEVFLGQETGSKLWRNVLTCAGISHKFRFILVYHFRCAILRLFNTESSSFAELPSLPQLTWNFRIFVCFTHHAWSDFLPAFCKLNLFRFPSMVQLLPFQFSFQKCYKKWYTISKLDRKVGKFKIRGVSFAAKPLYHA